MYVLKNWRAKFASGYKLVFHIFTSKLNLKSLYVFYKLELGCSFVENSLGIKLDDPDLPFEIPLDLREQQNRTRAIRRQKYFEIVEEMKLNSEKIMENIEIMKECIRLLLPSVDNFLYSSNASVPLRQVSRSDIIQEHGLVTKAYKLVVEIDSNDIGVKETAENSAIFETLRDGTKLLNKHFLKVSRWLDAISKADVEDQSAQEQHTRQAIDLKQLIQEFLGKSARFESLDSLKEKSKITSDFNNSDDCNSNYDSEDDKDEIFEEIVIDPIETNPVWVNKPVNFLSQSDEENCKNSNDEINNSSLLNQKDELIISKESQLDISNEKLKIFGELVPCGALLKNGKLCPRRDLQRCPLHGKIAPRDNMGRMITPDGKLIEDMELKVDSSSIWEELEAEINVMVGEELPTKRKGRLQHGEDKYGETALMD
ncbi:hypothetical protein HK096_004332, partial [Nowakowskiella sp. JEL0078]